MKRKYTLIVAVLAALALTSASVASADIYGVDKNHGLETDKSIEQFQTEGVATGEADDLDLTLTASRSSENVATDQMIDAGKLYLEVDYREDIARTIRFYVSDEYFEPHTDQSMTVHNADVNAEMEPVDGGNYTAVTVHTDGPTTAVLEISTVESRLWEIRHNTQDWLDKATGVSVPSIGGGPANPWEYVDSSEFASNSSVSVAADATVQYNAAENDSDATWLEVPECNGAETPVCTVEQGDTTEILAENGTDAPQVRHKTNASLTDRVGAGFREVFVEAQSQLEAIREAISGVTG